MDRVAAQMSDIGVKDQSLIWNTDLVEALELENLMGQALSPSVRRPAAGIARRARA